MPTLKQQGHCVFLVDKIGPDAVDAPILVAGHVVPTATGNREPTQDPMTGFACGDTPLGRGHIVALFLGGPDIAENYAPQYEQWQQGGAWKNMELNVQQLALQAAPTALYMVVRLTYGRHGNNYAAEQLAFANGQIHDWDDARIPSRFDVWTFGGGDLGAAPVIAALSGANVAAAMLALPGQGFVQLRAAFDVTQMPVEDYRFWLRNLIRNWARHSASQARQAYLAELAQRETDALVAQHMASLASAKPKKGIGKAKPRRVPVQTPRGPRLPRTQAAAIQATLQRKHGFNEHVSLDAWTLANVDQVAADIQGRLAGGAFGIRPPDLLLLNSAAAAQFVAQQLQ